MRISDWSSDVCSSDLRTSTSGAAAAQGNAQATISGTVEGGTYLNAGRGDATVTFTGVSPDYVSAITGSSVSSTTAERAWTGKTKSASAVFGTLVASLTEIRSASSRERVVKYVTNRAV